MICLIALITRREQARATSDGIRISVGGDGSHFSGQLSGRDDVDAGNRHQTRIHHFLVGVLVLCQVFQNPLPVL